MSLMRSVFYVPANNQKFIDKALTLPCDIVTFDIEDAIAPSEKAVARKMAAESYEKFAGGSAEVYVRINSWPTEFTNDDLEALVWPGLNGVTATKVRDADDIKRVEWKLYELEARRNIPEGTVKICALIETAIGVVNAYSICSASTRMVSAIFGAVDFCADMRVTLTNEGKEQYYGRAAVGVAARAAGIVALDAPFADFSNLDAFAANTEEGKQLGFEGRMIIHPSQIEVANKVYAPSEKEVEHARKVVKIFEEEGLAKGLAAVALEGKMVDTPVYVSAKGVLSRHEDIMKKENAAK